MRFCFCKDCPFQDPDAILFFAKIVLFKIRMRFCFCKDCSFQDPDAILFFANIAKSQSDFISSGTVFESIIILPFDSDSTLSNWFPSSFPE